ncbi:hypothetical protein G3O08_09035 [Cryomorpha ignava]|uniref:Lipoprotein n=1 Tax=Cryomorpha ignava TaxID=101383 RepID=A0A7K3WSL5_9FLAO|nr:hypothetical protein [Cryomorpha ignava]NEN23645.1 hypothetical protein [Cryomorpha ignava]
MKKTISLISGLAFILVITSCSNAHKGCAAYAKHETIDKTPVQAQGQHITPAYKDLQ